LLVNVFELFGELELGLVEFKEVNELQKLIGPVQLGDPFNIPHAGEMLLLQLFEAVDSFQESVSFGSHLN
jgi:hypothetical protein